MTFDASDAKKPKSKPKAKGKTEGKAKGNPFAKGAMGKGSMPKGKGKDC